jgi:hypothetical protein
MTRTATALAAVALALASAGASAQTQTQTQTGTPRVDTRQANQDARIDQGVASGALTAPETRRLEQGQVRFARIEDRAKADGVVTRQERVRLHPAQDVEGRRIFGQKHDRQHDVDRNGRIDRPAMR